MKIDVTLYDSDTDDLAIVIDLLRASTTIITALDYFDEIIPVDTIEKAFKIKEQGNVILAGEKKAKKIEGFDVSNSPHDIKNHHGQTLVLKTTNGTAVINNIIQNNPQTKILIGSSINARKIAQKSLELATREINLVMAGVHKKFTIEDCVGAGIIINEIIQIAQKEEITIELTESAQAAQMITTDNQKSQELINSSQSAQRLRKLNAQNDINICKLINQSSNTPIYANGKITLIE